MCAIPLGSTDTDESPTVAASEQENSWGKSLKRAMSNACRDHCTNAIYLVNCLDCGAGSGRKRVAQIVRGESDRDFLSGGLRYNAVVGGVDPAIGLSLPAFWKETSTEMRLPSGAGLRIARDPVVISNTRFATVDLPSRIWIRARSKSMSALASAVISSGRIPWFTISRTTSCKVGYFCARLK